MGYNILLLSVATIFQWTNIHAQIPECSTVGGSCEVSCEEGFQMPMPSCAGDKICCKKSVSLALEIFSPDASALERRNGRCKKGRKACRRAKGACVNKVFGCSTAVVDGLCKGDSCQCCLKDNCKSKKTKRGKKGCKDKGGECKLAVVGCSGNQTETSGCKGKRCVCCVGPPLDYRPYCDHCGEATIEPTRIIGGQETEVGEYPWQALIILSATSGAESASLCGGSLIKDKWVLTAAHCFDGITYGGMIVSLGDHNSQTGDEVSSETYIYSGQEYQDFVTLHPNFIAPGENDIAVIELKFPYPKNKPGIKPICLATPEDIVVGDKAVVTGWGFTEYRGDPSDVLLEVELDLISVEDCTTKYQNTTQKFDISENNICTLTPDKDACLGDSGGPLIRQIPDGRWVQIGIVSFGFQCAFNDAPGVYTNVANYKDWIDEVTKSDQCL